MNEVPYLYWGDSNIYIAKSEGKEGVKFKNQKIFM